MPSSPLTNRVLFGRLLALAFQYRWSCLWLVMLQMVLLAMGLAGLALVGLAIDLVAAHAHPGSATPHWPFGWLPPDDWSPPTQLFVVALAVLAAALCRAILNYRYAVAVARVTQERIVVDLRAHVFDKLQRLSFRFFGHHSSGSLINRVTMDVQSVRLFIDGVVLQLVILLISLPCYLAYMFRIHVGLSVACLATTPALWWLSTSFSRRIRPAYYHNRELVDRMLSVLTEAVRGISVIKGFGREAEQVDRFRQANAAVRDQQQNIFWRVSLFVPTSEFLMSINLVVLLGYGGWLVIHDRLSVGTGLVVLAGLLQQFAGQISKMTSILNSIQQSLTGAERVFEILDAPIEIRSPERARRLGRARGSIQFDRVSFGYAPGRLVLRDLSFRLEPGEHLGILAATGAGKTTLLNLVPRFYDPTAGRVLLDGIDLRELDLEDLRQNIGLVFQENFLFSDTAAANIAFGRPATSLAQIEEAARIAAADGFVRDLPLGYQTTLREGGKDLSGGQRQRIAIARALLLRPPILLLDDPTAAIDAETEQEILDAMDQAMADRTAIFVAHRLSMLQRAHRILVLHEGRMVEMGTPDELLARGGAYAYLAAMQAPGYGVPSRPVAVPSEESFAAIPVVPASMPTGS